MAELDLSKHSLNFSQSKQKYSFPKTKRFADKHSALCDSLYQLPSTMTKRGTSLGYGHKTMGEENNSFVPGVGAYTFKSQINPEQNKQRSFTFGVSREKMESGGALGIVKYLQRYPAPGAYKEKNVRDLRGPTLRSRLPDHEFQKFIKNPGPGTYDHENMGTSVYYLNSRYKNDTNGKISQVSRLQPITTKRLKVGPADYNPIDSLNGKGKNHFMCVPSIEQAGTGGDYPERVPRPRKLQLFFGFRLKRVDQQSQQFIHMIKPKSQSYKVKVMLIKLEAVTNRVATRCQASLKIDGEQQFFKASPQLRKNVALFNSQVEFEHFLIQVDEVTGLYQNKQALLMIDIETQGTKMRMGEVSINLGGILNQKKYRIVNQYPLAKCYDKTAKVRLSVDFVPITGPESQVSQKKEVREFKSSHVVLSKDSSEPYLPPFAEKRIKSRLAEQSNVILQDKIFEYQQKMDNYRLSQTQIQEKLYEQISSKDQQITELTIEVNQKADQLSALNLENEKLRFRIKEQGQEIDSLKEQKKSLVLMVQNLQKCEEGSKKEIQTLKISVENLTKTKEGKQKYYSQELAKYTVRYQQSEQERNKIIFELESKFKEEMEKKENNYRSVLTASQKKYQQNANHLRQKIKKLQQALRLQEQKLEQTEEELRKYRQALNHSQKEEKVLRVKLIELQSEVDKLKKMYTESSHELQTLLFSYNEMDRDLGKSKEEVQNLKKSNEQLKMELIIANQTIDEQYKTITKNNRELQNHQEREYYLTQKYSDELQMKSINEENILGETQYYRQEIHKLKNKLKIAEERADEETSKANELAESLQRIDSELANRGQTLMRLGEEKMTIENELKMVRGELADMEEAVLVLKEQNMQLSDLLREKREALENDKSIEWTYKIEQLQNDISEMVEKFRVEKEAMKDSFRREQNKRKEELANATLTIRKGRDETEQLKKQLQRKQTSVKDLQKKVQQLKNEIKVKSQNYDEVMEKMKLSHQQHEELEKKARTTESVWENRVKDAQSKIGKEVTQMKRLELAKTALQKIIQLLLQYLTRPYQSVIGFQELTIPDADAEFLNLINLSLRKHCEERTKIREQLKKAEGIVLGQKVEVKKVESEVLRSKEKTILVDIQEKSSRIYQGNVQMWKQQPKSSSYECEQLRQENSRLKRQISQLKIKIRSVEEQVSRAERAADMERNQRSEVRHQLEEIQDEVDKLSFQLKRKDKVLIEYENQIRDLQTEIVNLRVSQNQTKTQSIPSRAETRLREKEETTSNNRRQIVIRDLEAKLQAKTKQFEEVMTENDKIRGDNSSLREAVVHLNNEVKLLDSKYKDRCSKFSSQQAQYLQARSKLQDDLHSASLRHKQELEELAEELLKVQDESIYHQKLGERSQKQIQDMEKKMKTMRQEFKVIEAKSKREYESIINKLKENVSELEETVAELKSSIEQLQLKSKQENLRSSNQTVLLAKRTEQISCLGETLRQKEQILFQLEEQLQILQAQHQGRIEELKDRIEEVQEQKLKIEYELEEYKFTSEGRILDMERRLEEAGLKTV